MEDFDLIETPENVELQRRLAGLGSRFTAGVLDSLYMFLVFVGLFLMVTLLTWSNPIDVFIENNLEGWGIAVLVLLAFGVYWFYFAFFEMVMNGQSPGKRSVQIRVVKDGGGAITFTDIAIRNLLRAVDGLAFYAVAGAVMFATKKMQRLGDLAAGTLVVSEQRYDYRARTDKGRAADWEAPTEAEAYRDSGLTPAEYRLLANYWSRREELSLEARQRLLPRLVLPILERTGRSAPDQSHDGLEQLVAGWLEGDTAYPSPPAQNYLDERKETP